MKKKLSQGVKETRNKTISALKMLCKQYASDMQTYMKQNRPWEDRTNAARLGLYGEFYTKEEDKVLVIEVGHSSEVPYGVYLEWRTFPVKGRLPIVFPTIDIFVPKIQNSINNLLDKIDLPQ